MTTLPRSDSARDVSGDAGATPSRVPRGARFRSHAWSAESPVVALAPGRVTGVSVRGSTVTLWNIDADPLSTGHGPRRVLGPDASAAWRSAGMALPRSMPLLWRSVEACVRHPPFTSRLGVYQASVGIEEREPLLDGSSFGLCFVLALASFLAECAVPVDIIASARVDERGVLRPVDAIELKIEGVVRLAPAVRRLLVAADQAAEAERASAGRLEIVAVASAADALRLVFGDSLSDALVGARTDEAKRAELADTLFRLALVGRGAVVDWSPIERAAALALQTWTAIDDDQRYRLVFARAVAARHARNEGELSMPTPEWLASQPAALRLGVIAHLVQQSADTGRPSALEAELFALAHVPAYFENALTPDLEDATIPSLKDALVPHLKLLGALARLWAATGRVRAALALQQQLAHAFVASYAEEEVSYPLTEWFRLAGILQDAESFRRADELWRGLSARGLISTDGTPYLDRARAHAERLLKPQV